MQFPNPSLSHVCPGRQEQITKINSSEKPIISYQSHFGMSQALVFPILSFIAHSLSLTLQPCERPS